MLRNTERETIARAIIVENGCLLVNHAVNKHTGQEYYALPGGHAHVSESCIAALSREFREELAAEINIGDLQFVSESIYEGRRRDDGARHELVLYYAAELRTPLGQEDGRIMSPEFDKDFIWLPLEKLGESNLLPPTVRDFLQNSLSREGNIVASGSRYAFHDFNA